MDYYFVIIPGWDYLPPFKSELFRNNTKVKDDTSRAGHGNMRYGKSQPDMAMVTNSCSNCDGELLLEERFISEQFLKEMFIN